MRVAYHSGMYARALAAFLLSLFAAFPCVAYAQDSVFIDDLTSPELQALIRDGRTIALVPIGGTEQNGPHMALGKHNVRVKALAEKIARALGNALVAPVIAYVPEGGVNPPTSHMRFAGTITIPAAAFESVLEYAARSFRARLPRHRVHRRPRRLPAQRGGRGAAAQSRMGGRAGARARARRVLPRDRHAVSASAEARGFTDAEIGTHAGVADTSLALAVDPRFVRGAQLAAGIVARRGARRGRRSAARSGGSRQPSAST